MKEKCVIFGAGRYGIVSYELLKEIYDIIGFSDCFSCFQICQF